MIALLLAAALGTPKPTPTLEPMEGVEALCAQVAQLASPQLVSRTVSVQLVAEGAALDLADEVTSRCTQQLLGEGHAAPLATAERVARIRLRLSAPSLVALVEITSGSNVLVTGTVEVPAGPKLARWLSAAGAGLETWLAGTVDGDVLALCGGDPDGDGGAEVAFVTATAIEVARWRSNGFESVVTMELPPTLRAKARAPAASAACRVVDGALEVVFGIHDRGLGGVVRVVHGVAQPLQPLDGIPFGFGHSGQSLVADGVAGTGLARWKGSDVAAIAVAPERKRKEGDSVEVVWLGQNGTSPALGLKAGAALAVADLDGDHKAEIIYERAVFRGDGDDDRLIVAPLASPRSVRYQSPSIPGVLGALGVVTVGGWQRVLAAQWADGRSRIYALGTRSPSNTVR